MRSHIWFRIGNRAQAFGSAISDTVSMDCVLCRFISRLGMLCSKLACTVLRRYKNFRCRFATFPRTARTRSAGCQQRWVVVIRIIDRLNFSRSVRKTKEFLARRMREAVGLSDVRRTHAIACAISTAAVGAAQLMGDRVCMRAGSAGKLLRGVAASLT